MFTGIIEQKTQVKFLEILDNCARLELYGVWTDVEIGESIAVNGVCLTVLTTGANDMCFDLSLETLNVTKMKTLRAGTWVNLERAVKVSARMGGHYVSGHVDTQAILVEKKASGAYQEYILSSFDARDSHLYLLPKASLTVDGVSLTINRVEKDKVSLMLVPHTLDNTALGLLHPGDPVNIEFDYITRIVAHQLQSMGQLKNEVQA